MAEYFLSKDECLVYIKNNEPIPDTDNTTYIAKIVKSYKQNGNPWYDVILVTDAVGNPIENNNRIITISSDKIVINKPWHNIPFRKLYHFGDPLLAQSFVIKSTINNPLESTSRNALGSGIYGIYLNKSADLGSIIINPNRKVYEINCEDCYIVQDKGHGESITTASLTTNRYIDTALLSLGNTINYNDALVYIKSNDISNIVILWNIVLYRSNENIVQSFLENILAKYLVIYLQSDELFDSKSNEAIIEMPINFIMFELGYSGLLTTDVHNDLNWDRGCVSYEYQRAVMILGGKASY